MKAAATYPLRRDGVRLLALDSSTGTAWQEPLDALSRILAPGDLLVVNDAATLPASLVGHDALERPVEARLCGREDDGTFRAVLFGAGTWRTRTEDRPPPPVLPPGAALSFSRLEATITAVSARSPRLVRLRFSESGDALFCALYASGRPIQYAHLAHELPLWAVQTGFAGPPVSFEMPSAGRPLSWQVLLGLRRVGVQWAHVTHAAGLSATGDAALDAALPLPERYDIPAATVAAIDSARGRVIAVGTTVARALEGAASAGGGRLRSGGGVTDLRIGPGHALQVVQGLLTGMHAPGESHYDLLRAFASDGALEGARALATARGFETHELGDVLLVAPGLGASTRLRPARAPASRVSLQR